MDEVEEEEEEEIVSKLPRILSKGMELLSRRMGWRGPRSLKELSSKD